MRRAKPTTDHNCAINLRTANFLKLRFPGELITAAINKLIAALTKIQTTSGALAGRSARTTRPRASSHSRARFRCIAECREAAGFLGCITTRNTTTVERATTWRKNVIYDGGDGTKREGRTSMTREAAAGYLSLFLSSKF